MFAKLCRKSRQQDPSTQRRILLARLLKNIENSERRTVKRKVIDNNECVGFGIPLYFIAQ